MQDRPVLGLYSSAFLKGLAHGECCCVPQRQDLVGALL